MTILGCLETGKAATKASPPIVKSLLMFLGKSPAPPIVRILLMLLVKSLVPSVELLSVQSVDSSSTIIPPPPPPKPAAIMGSIKEAPVMLEIEYHPLEEAEVLSEEAEVQVLR